MKFRLAKKVLNKLFLLMSKLFKILIIKNYCEERINFRHNSCRNINKFDIIDRNVNKFHLKIHNTYILFLFDK